MLFHAGRDQIAFLEFTDYAEDFFNYTRGRVIIAPDGSNTRENDNKGNHRYAVPGLIINEIKFN